MITTGNAGTVVVEQNSQVSVSINYGFTQQLKFWSQFWLQVKEYLYLDSF